MEAVVRWHEGLHFSGEADSGIKVHMDGKPATGETRQGASPMELMAFSLIGCTGMDVISILKKMRQDARGLEIRFDGDQQGDHPRIFNRIHVEYVVSGKNLDPERVARAVTLSMEQYCPAHAILRKSVNVTHSHRIVEAG